MTLDPTTPLTAVTGHTPAASVWATGQAAPAAQRVRGRYHPDSVKHPAKMLPAIVQHAVQAYTRPGDLVLDPMCGIGTTLVESLHLGRRVVGVEYEARWAELARSNLACSYFEADRYADAVDEFTRTLADREQVL
uniref:TRM11 family SAM-dependent methyltransferase n=1 Tax=Nocardia wallacei TaxID=480035 RepID=UPI0024579F8A